MTAGFDETLRTLYSMQSRGAKLKSASEARRLSLVGAVRSKWYGGQGAVQSFVGYTSGLNSAHLMFSNDGNVPNQDGTDLPFFRWQPKLNFDIAL